MRSLLLLVLAIPTTGAHAIDALILHGVSFDPTYHGEVAATLLASGQFNLVDEWAGDIAAPRAQDLAAYDVVLTMPDAAWNDARATGAALAEFVDNGGGVVDSVFSFGNQYFGRFYSDGYVPVWTANPFGAPRRLGNFRPGHPVMAGVTQFEDPYLHSDSNIAVHGAEAIAAYANGSVLVAGWKPTGAGNVLAINFYPPSSNLQPDFWNAATDGAQLLVNAMVEAANGSYNADFSTHATGQCGQTTNLNVQNATPGGPVAIVSGQSGLTTIPSGACAGTAIPLTNAVVRNLTRANARGHVGMTFPFLRPCGVDYVAIDLTTCAVSTDSLPR
jgi:hypothetical protein